MADAALAQRPQGADSGHAGKHHVRQDAKRICIVYAEAKKARCDCTSFEPTAEAEED